MAAHPVALLCLVALLAGLARGFSGFGAALIFMPLASAIAGPQTAAAILVLVDLVFAAPLIPKAWSRVSLTSIGTMLAGATLMIPIGAWLLKTTDPTILRWLIAGLAALMLALLISGWRFTGHPRPAITFAVGALSGLFSGIAQIGGPPVVAYWLGGAASAANTRANIIIFFAGTGLVSLVVYLASGFVTHTTLTWAMIAGPLYGLGLFGGTRLFGSASERTFRRVCFALIAVSVALSLPVWR
jgi:uncharacterized protein